MATTLASLIARRFLPRRLRSFGRDCRGVTAVEFGLLALPFFSIMCAIMETSLVFLSGQILETAVQDTSRLIRTGQAKGTIVTADDFRQKVCDRVLGLFGDCAGLYVGVRAVGSFAGVTIAPPLDPDCTSNCVGWTEADKYTSGQGSSFMVVEVYYKWPIILSLGSFQPADLPDGDRLISAVTVFRNEPFT